MNQSQQIYRITYEAFSQFSSRLLKVNSLEELRICLQSRTKYLFDYKYIRISSNYNNRWIHLEFNNTESLAQASESAILLAHEEELIQKGIPKTLCLNDLPDLAPQIQENRDKHSVWCWHIEGTTNSHITLSLVGNAHQVFNETKVPVIKLYIEVIESKLLQILLYNQIAEQNEELSEAVHTIREKNTEIQAIIEQQDAVIARQTEHLEIQNSQLRKIAVLNAHQVREPLSRVLGLARISSFYDAEELKSEILPKLQQSSEELDNALKEVIIMAEKPLHTKKEEV